MPLRNIVEAQIKLKGLTKRQVAAYMQINPATFHRKCCGTSDFTMPEMAKLQEILQFEHPWEVFFSQLVA